MTNKKSAAKNKRKTASSKPSGIKHLLKKLNEAIKQLRSKRDDQKSILKKLKQKNKKKSEQKIIEKKITKWKKKEQGLKKQLLQLEKEKETAKKKPKSKSAKKDKKERPKSKKGSTTSVVKQTISKETQKLPSFSKTKEIEKRKSIDFLAREAISRLRKISDIEILLQFTSGDKRVTIINATKSRTNAINRDREKKQG